MLLFLCLQQQRKSNQKSMPRAGSRGNQLLPFFCPGKRKVTERKPARPRYAKFAMQLLRLGSGELTLTLKVLYFTNPFPCLKNIPSLFIQGEGSNNTALTPRLRRHCLHFAPLWRVCLIATVSRGRFFPSNPPYQRGQGVVSSIPLAVSVFFLFSFFISSIQQSPLWLIPSGHCHHLSVECLAIAPTGKSYPPLRQEMQEAFRPEHMRQEAECARVDFPCSYF